MVDYEENPARTREENKRLLLDAAWAELNTRIKDYPINPPSSPTEVKAVKAYGHAEVKAVIEIPALIQRIGGLRQDLGFNDADRRVINLPSSSYIFTVDFAAGKGIGDKQETPKWFMAAFEKDNTGKATPGKPPILQRPGYTGKAPDSSRWRLGDPSKPPIAHLH